MAVIKVTTADFENVVLKSDKPVLVDFNADWCGPCRMLAPLLEEIAASRDDIKVVSVNVDDEGELAAQFGISSIPCIIAFKDGAEKKRSIGFRGKEAIEDMLMIS